MRTGVVVFDCPWCDAFNAKAMTYGADIDVACVTCKKPIDLVIDSWGNMKRCKRLNLSAAENDKLPNNTHKDNTNVAPSIHIGTNYGSVAFGGNASTTTNIYSETIREIDQARNVEPEKKNQAKGILTYVNDYAKPFLPIIAAATKHALGL